MVWISATSSPRLLPDVTARCHLFYLTHRTYMTTLPRGFHWPSLLIRELGQYSQEASNDVKNNVCLREKLLVKKNCLLKKLLRNPIGGTSPAIDPLAPLPGDRHRAPAVCLRTFGPERPRTRGAPKKNRGAPNETRGARRKTKGAPKKTRGALRKPEICRHRIFKCVHRSWLNGHVHRISEI